MGDSRATEEAYYEAIVEDRCGDCTSHIGNFKNRDDAAAVLLVGVGVSVDGQAPLGGLEYSSSLTSMGCYNGRIVEHNPPQIFQSLEEFEPGIAEKWEKFKAHQQSQEHSRRLAEAEFARKAPELQRAAQMKLSAADLMLLQLKQPTEDEQRRQLDVLRNKLSEDEARAMGFMQMEHRLLTKFYQFPGRGFARAIDDMRADAKALRAKT